MSRYTLLTILLLLSSIYPVTFLLGQIDDFLVVILYAIVAFIFSFALARAMYGHCTTLQPMRYHLSETWLLYFVSITVFVYYYSYQDRCSVGLCRDIIGLFWSLVCSIPIWVHIGFLSVECASKRKHPFVIQVPIILGVTALGLACAFFLLNLLYAQLVLINI